MPDAGGFARSAVAGSGVGALLTAGVDLDAIQRGLITQTYPSYLASAQIAPTSGRIQGSRLWHPGGLITNILIASGQTPEVGGVANQNFAGIYDTAGNRLAQTAALDASLTPVPAGGAPFVFPLTAPVSLPPQFLDIATLQNFATIGANFIGINLQTGNLAVGVPSTAGQRAWTADTGAVALPAVLGAKSFTLGAYIWMGLN